MSTWLELLTAPVALVAWALVALAWLTRRGAASAGVRRLSAALAVLWFAAATPLGANAALGLLEGEPRPAEGACRGPVQVVVVLAGGVSGRPAAAGDVASLHVSSLRRVLEGVALARASPAARLIVSGGNGGEVREADLMASLVTSLGIPPARVLLERESFTTAQAAANVARLVAREGSGAPVHLVTSAMHMPRAAGSFRRGGLAVCPVPVDRRRVRPGPVEALVPQLTALEKSTAAYHELIGLAWYRVTGRL